MRMSELAMDVEEERGIGDNDPPSPIDYTREAMADLNKFLTDNPVIETIEQAKEGSLFVERSRKTLQDLDDARKTEVGPLNEQVKAINEQFRSVRAPMDRVVEELRRRLTDYAAKEEARRIREAEEARKLAEAAEMEARRAEEAEREAKAGATFGEITDVAAAVIEADQSFSRFAQADRAAQLAERDTHVRLPSQLGGKALGLRTKDTFTLDNPTNAIDHLWTVCGLSEKVNAAILSDARAYYRETGKLPPGVRVEHTRFI